MVSPWFPTSRTSLSQPCAGKTWYHFYGRFMAVTRVVTLAQDANAQLIVNLAAKITDDYVLMCSGPCEHR
jgi:hypothetical protein